MKEDGRGLEDCFDAEGEEEGLRMTTAMWIIAGCEVVKVILFLILLAACMME